MLSSCSFAIIKMFAYEAVYIISYTLSIFVRRNPEHGKSNNDGLGNSQGTQRWLGRGRLQEVTS